MARINIEDSLHAEPAFKRLVRILGNEDLAVGLLYRFWRAAQDYWAEDRSLMPEAEFIADGFEPLAPAGLVTKTSSGVKAAGSERQFEWYRKQVVSERAAENAASLGGQARAETALRDEHGRFLPNKVQPEPSATQLYPAALPLPLPLSLSLKKEEEEKKKNTVAGATASSGVVKKRSKYSDATREKMRVFIAKYAERYREKYGGPPQGLSDRAVIGRLGTWIEEVSQERATQLVEAYLLVDHRPINESCHDLWNFFRHLNRIGLALDRGGDPAGIDWSKVFGGGM